MHERPFSLVALPKALCFQICQGGTMYKRHLFLKRNSTAFQQGYALVLALLLTCFPGFAQQGRGTISGSVTDPSGAAVPGANITITNVGTNAVFSTQSNEEGFFTAPGLAVGEYIVNAERQGF